MPFRTEYEVDVLRTEPVAQIMTPDVETLAADDTVGDVRRRFAHGNHSAYPIVADDDRLWGTLARRDILASDADDGAPVGDVASRDVVTVSRDDTAHTALLLMLEGQFGHTPVVDRGRLVGLVTRTDITRARMVHLPQEQRQDGLVNRIPWLRRLER